MAEINAETNEKLKLAKTEKNDRRKSFIITDNNNICREVIIYQQSKINLQSFQLSIPPSLCNGATLARPQRLSISGLDTEKNFNKIMNSADALNIAGNMQGAEEDTSRNIDTFMQGSENQESPGAGSAHSSISPPISVMHDIATVSSPAIITGQQATTTIPVTLSQICTPTTASLGHQILVDPTTGQHFLVSSAPPPPHPQIIYQPVYYSATPPQPVYYHPFTSGAPGAYVVAATPITTSQTVTPIASTHMTLGQRFSSTPPPPPSSAQSIAGCFVRSVADFDDTRSAVTTDERHTVFDHSLISTPRSHAADTKQIFVSKNSNSPPQSSLALSQNCSIFDNYTTTPLRNSQKNSAQLHHPQEAITYQEAINKPAIPAQAEDGERTPLFGAAPAWWGENSTSDVQMQKNDDENTRNATVGNTFHRPLKSIRMDIDLNEPFIDEEAKKEDKTKIAQRTSSSTAFTVSFDSEEDSQKVNLSLQDAAKKTSSRRFMRRNMPITGLVCKGTAAKIAGLRAASSDPKQYLLNKMLMGVGEECGEEPDLTGSYEQEGKKQDIDDTLSEAGTYVVDGDRGNQMITSQTIKDSDAESVSSESTTTQSTENLRSTAPIHRRSVLPQINENVSNAGSGTETNEHLLRDLLRSSPGRVSRGEHQAVAPSTPPLLNLSRVTAATGNHAGVARRSETARTEERQYSTHRLCNIASSSRTSQLHRTQPIASASGICDNTFRRGDGGRYSMRFSGANNSKGHHSTSAMVSRNDRPPFRVGGSGGSGRNQASGAKTNKESAEMIAWLRRKDYNPMKAAAEAKKLQQLKARADKFASNRSISFHQGTRPITNILPIIRNSNRARHNRSQDDLSVDNTVCGPETILVNYSKGVTRDLDKLRSVEATQDQNHMNGLENAVQQLTMKCNRSIELIRNSHQGHLSESVENLLEMAIEPVKDCTGTVTDQLDRLSAAFDAIQKYLEVSSTSLPASPSGSSPTASVTALSTSPSRRPCSAYQSKLAAAKRNSSGGQKNL
ncbi:A-type inclusion protein [Dirofilaria immitis]